MKRWKLKEIGELLGVSIKSELEVTGISTDSRTILPGNIYIAIEGEKFDGHDFVQNAFNRGAAACVCSKYVDVDMDQLVIQVDNTRETYLFLSTAYRNRFNVKVVGVTGSVGKTTTKDMIATAVASQKTVIKTMGNLNNDIGVPTTLFTIEGDTEVAVVEMGMDHLGEIATLSGTAKPDISVITNVGVSHIENLQTRKNILKAKLEIVEGMPPGAPLIINYDNDLLAALQNYMGHRMISYGIKNRSAQIRAIEIQENSEKLETTFTITDGLDSFWCVIPCIGEHNVLNALAAYCVSKELGIDRQKAVSNLKNYVPSGMRQNIVKIKGITVIEDCYNASPDSMVAAIGTLRKLKISPKNKKIAVLGDMLELGDMSKEAHTHLGFLVAESGVDALFACGNDAYYVLKGAEEHGFSNSFFSNSKDEVLKRLLSKVHDGDVVLFKGSRGIGLEYIINKLYSALGEER